MFSKVTNVVKAMLIRLGRHVAYDSALFPARMFCSTPGCVQRAWHFHLSLSLFLFPSSMFRLDVVANTDSWSGIRPGGGSPRATWTGASASADSTRSACGAHGPAACARRSGRVHGGGGGGGWSLYRAAGRRWRWCAPDWRAARTSTRAARRRLRMGRGKLDDSAAAGRADAILRKSVIGNATFDTGPDTLVERARGAASGICCSRPRWKSWAACC